MKVVVALAALLIALPANAAARFAVVVGNNIGATGRAKLWFAERDAELDADIRLLMRQLEG